MAEGHAVFAPSKMHRILQCPGSVAMEAREPDKRSDYADHGSAAHFVGAECLDNQAHPSEYLGRGVIVTGSGARWAEDDDLGKFEVDQEMVDALVVYIAHVDEYVGDDGELLVEQRLPIDHITGEKDAEGTGDAVILRLADKELVIGDLKYGRGVEVSAVENPQLMTYGLGALEKYGMLGDFERVRFFISQPRISRAASEWDCSIEDLQAFGNRVRQAVKHARNVLEGEHPDAIVHHLHPQEDACRFCKAKAVCPKLAITVREAVLGQFEDLTSKPAIEKATAELAGADHPTLAQKMAVCGLIEDWIKAVRAEVERRLLAGDLVPGYKLVQGREGARQWTDANEVELALKAMRLKVEEMYDLSLISPTSAEKLAKAKTIGPKQWTKLQGLIHRAAGKPSVAPESDKRPALQVTAAIDQFDDLTGADLVGGRR